MIGRQAEAPSSKLLTSVESKRNREREAHDCSADESGYVAPSLWTGGARSGCGAALVGSPDQVLSKLEDYREMGIRAFIL